MVRPQQTSRLNVTPHRTILGINSLYPPDGIDWLIARASLIRGMWDPATIMASGSDYCIARGSHRVTLVPIRDSDSIVTFPPDCCAKSDTRVNPSPVPLSGSFVVKKGSKT